MLVKIKTLCFVIYAHINPFRYQVLLKHIEHDTKN
jgi:hypothetical protein